MMSHVITSSARMYGSWWRQSVTYYQSVQILDIFTTKVYEFWVFLWNCTNIGRPSPFIRDHHTFISSSWGRIVGLMGLVCINDCIHGNLYSEFHAISSDTTHDISQTSLSRSIRLKLTVSKSSVSATFLAVLKKRNLLHEMTHMVKIWLIHHLRWFSTSGYPTECIKK